MSAGERPDRRGRRHRLERQIASKQARKLEARRTGDRSIWFGLGTFGLIGWSVAVPTLIGVAIGLWIDNRWPSRYSWTLTMLVIGVAVGCLNAWWWVQRESRPSHDENGASGKGQNHD